MKYTLKCTDPSEPGMISSLKKVPKETTELKVRGEIPLTGLGARYIAENLTKVTRLDLNRNEIGNEVARCIAENMTQIIRLDLSHNRIDTEGVRYIAENSKGLTSLNLSGNQIGDKGAQYIAESLKGLTSLNLSDNQIGIKGTRYISESLTELRYLGLGHNQIRNMGAEYIAKNLSNIIYLELEYSQIYDEGVIHISENLNNIYYLDLSFNGITDLGVYHISNNIKKIEYLYLNNNNISDDGLKYISKNMREIYNLDFSFNNTLKTPEKILNDIDLFRAYFKIQDTKKQVLNSQVRGMLIGEPEVGKTTLLKALMKTPFVHGAERRTHGLKRGEVEFKRINHHYFKMQDLQLDIWDMGGQSLQLMMHGFFFRSDAIYLLLINEQSSFDAIKPWLNQLKHQRQREGNSKIIIVPVLNPTKNATEKISGSLIGLLKSEFEKNFDWMPQVIVDLSDEHHPNVEDLESALRLKLASFPLKEYWESIDDIASGLGQWPEHYCRGNRFIDKLRDSDVFKKSFSRITDKLQRENTDEVFDEREFAYLVRAMLDFKGIITVLKNPDFVIINPAWIEKGLYSLSPPEDKIVPEENSAAVFLQKLCSTDKDTHLPGIFTLPDIQPYWDDLGFNESNQEDLLSILSNETLGLVIKLDSVSGADRYFVPVYLEHIQDKTSKNLLDAITDAYQKAVFCIVYDNAYWPPYFIYRHMVLCGADEEYKNEHGLSFELFDHETTLSKQHYWIRSRNNPNLTIEIIFHQDRFWCFAHADSGQSIDIVQAELKRLKQDLYRILRRSSSEQSLEIKSLVPCPTCVSIHLTDAEQKNVSGINFYDRETLNTNKLSRQHMSCHIDHPSGHYAEASQVLNYLKSANSNEQDIDPSIDVTVISVFIYYCGLAVKEPSEKRNTLSLAGDGGEKDKIRSIDRGTLNRLWKGENIEPLGVEQLGAALIHRFGFLSLLTDIPKPANSNDKNGSLPNGGITYLNAIARRISEDTTGCIEKLKEVRINSQPLHIQFHEKRNARLPVDRPEFKWLKDHLNSRV